MQRFDVVNRLYAAVGFKDYLEIGVESGVTFNSVAIPSKVAVDPDFKIPIEQISGEAWALPSDEFFARDRRKFDCVFVDGLHIYEQALRDFRNGWDRLRPGGVVIIDDCYPSDEIAAMRDHAECRRLKELQGAPDRNWMGDVYKVVIWIHDHTQHRFAYVKDTMGVVVVWAEHEQRAPWVGGEEAIMDCGFDKFRSIAIPIMTIDEICERAKAVARV